MLQYLEKDLITSLEQAKSISIAVALIKGYGLNIIENNIPETCKRRYLVGIHLPTPPDILRKLLELQQKSSGSVFTRLYDSRENYHPKVYLIEKESGELIAFVGSANATRGGFTNNIEMNFAITEPDECEKLRHWFDNLFHGGKKYDENDVAKYEIVYKKNKILASTQKSNIDQVTSQSTSATSTALINPIQFFRQSDFDAFAEAMHDIDTSAAVEARAAVRERLIELAELIKPQFTSYNITDLNLAYQRNFYTSQHFHSARSPGAKEALWIHFGKSRSELLQFKEKSHQSITNHQRIQIILRNADEQAYIGVWLYLSKRNSSHFDRVRLREGLKDRDFVALLHEYIINLGDQYWLAIEGLKSLHVVDISDAQQIVDYFNKDTFKQEIIIGRNFDPNDSALSIENITETVLIEFSKLYKIYNLIKASPPDNNEVDSL